MISLPGAKKRAEELDAVADGRTARADLGPELAELADVVGALRARTAPVPRPEFSVALRERLMVEAETSLARDATLTLPARRHGVRERRLAVLAASVVMVGGSAGMAMAAQDALPGDALYPIKRGLEKASTELTSNDAGKGRELLAQADSRLDEVQVLLGRPTDLVQVAPTLGAFTDQITEGSAFLLDSYEAEGDADDIADLRTFAARSITTLQEVAKSAPAGYQDDLAVAATAVMRADELASAACSTCAPDLPPLEMPGLLMVAADAERAMAAVTEVELGNDHPPLGGGNLKAPGTGRGAKPSKDDDAGSAGGEEPGSGPGLPASDTGGAPGAGGTLGGTDGQRPVTGTPEDGLKDGIDKGRKAINDVLEDAGLGRSGAGKDSNPTLPAEVDELLDTLLP
jgi:hypothetical protein